MENLNKEYQAAVLRSMMDTPDTRKLTIEEIVLQKLESVDEELKFEEILNHVGLKIKTEVDDSIRGAVSGVLHGNDGKKVIHTAHGYWKILK